MRDFLTTAEDIVRQAGELASQSFGSVGVIGDHGQGNVFTEADVRVNEFICRRLAECYPDHAIRSEESGSTSQDGDYWWILDPIDGTRYYLGGIPLYSISLALEIRDELAVGVVFNPESGQLFSAGANGGARLNGTPIRCSAKRHLHESTVCVEIPHRLMEEKVRQSAARTMAVLMGKVERVRVIGASALGLCYCANGAFDLYLNMSMGSKEWDLAAGSLILRESGAEVGNHNSSLIGGPKGLRSQLIHALTTVTDP